MHTYPVCCICTCVFVCVTQTLPNNAWGAQCNPYRLVCNPASQSSNGCIESIYLVFSRIKTVHFKRHAFVFCFLNWIQSSSPSSVTVTYPQPEAGWRPPYPTWWFPSRCRCAAQTGCVVTTWPHGVCSSARRLSPPSPRTWSTCQAEKQHQVSRLEPSEWVQLYFCVFPVTSRGCIIPVWMFILSVFHFLIIPFTCFF